MARLLMQISYDGTGFHGWQNQINGISVQQVIEAKMAEVLHRVCHITGSGRTDTGVHAESQYAHFDYQGSMTPEQIRLALNVKLPFTIRIRSIIPVSRKFHARCSAYEREYRYDLAKVLTPFNRDFMGFVRYRKVRYDKILQCLPLFLGKHDFSSFSRPNPAIPNRICDVQKLTCIEYDDHYSFHIMADRFLHNMVRRIIGCMMVIASGDHSPDIITDLLQEKQPKQTLVPTAPANGLYLIRVAYPEHLLIPDQDELTPAFSEPEL